MQLFLTEKKRDFLGKLDELSALKNGQERVLFLKEHEKKELLKLENQLFKILEEINRTDYQTVDFYLNYFLESAQGKKQFEELFGVRPSDLSEIESAIFSQRKILRSNLNSVLQLAKDSEDFFRKFLKEELRRSFLEKGEFDLKNIKKDKRVKLLKDPQIFLERIRLLLKLRAEIEEILRNDNSGRDNFSDNFFLAKEELLEGIYQEKVRELLLSCWDGLQILNQVQQSVGDGRLSSEEKELFELMDMVNPGDFLDQEFGSKGYLFQLSFLQEKTRDCMLEDLSRVIEEFEREFGKFDLDQDNSLDNHLVSWEELKKIAQKALENCQERSFLEKSDDNFWKVELDENRTSMLVSFLSKKLKIGIKAKERTVFEAFVKLLGHEIEGHVFANLNRVRVGLKIFEQGFVPGFVLFSEAGAINSEQEIAREFFNILTKPQYLYLRAIRELVRGGDYYDCLGAFLKGFDSSIFKEREGEALEECLVYSIDRTARIFRKTVDLNYQSGEIVNLKDAAYSEAFLLLKELEKRDLKDLVYLGGMNLQGACFLAKFGFIDLNKLNSPDFYTKEIWGEWQLANQAKFKQLSYQIKSIEDVKKAIQQEGWKIFGIGGNPVYRNEAFFLGRELYELVCSNETGELGAVKEKIKVEVIQLKENPGSKKPGLILADSEVKKYIKENSRDKKVAIYVQQPAVDTKQECDKEDWRLIAGDLKVFERLNQRVEMLKVFKQAGGDKISRRFNLRDLGDSRLKELLEEFGGRVVLQVESSKLGGGRGTLFVDRENHKEVLGKVISRLQAVGAEEAGVEVLAAPFYQGSSVGIMGCVTEKNGVLVSFPRYQLIDIEESVGNKDDGEGVFCGHDWTLSQDIPRWAVEKAKELTVKIGEEIKEMGFKGVFGVDFILDQKNEQLVPLEINPRLLGSLPHEAFIQAEAEEVPLVAFHILEFLGIDYQIANRAVYQKDVPGEGAHLILFNFFGRDVVCREGLSGGVYQLDDQGGMEFLRPGSDVVDIKDSTREFILTDGVPTAGKKYEKNRKILKIVTKRSISEVGGARLNEWGQSVVEAVKSKISRLV